MTPLTLTFDFPLPRVHTGIHLGNGRMGVLVWGTEELRLTFAQNGFWDRQRAEGPVTPLTMAELTAHLLAGEESLVRAAFDRQVPTMTQLPGGRLTLDCGSAPTRGELDLRTGLLTITFASGTTLEILHSVADDSLLIRWNEGDEPKATLQPSWHWASESLSRRGLPAPDTTPDSFRQPTPTDETFWASLSRGPGLLTLRTKLAPRSASEEDFDEWRPARPLWDSELSQSKADWGGFWPRIPLIETVHREVWLYSLWKLHILHHPKGVAPTLQGAWMEDHRIPLWSNDYHFNINLQMMLQACIDLELWDHSRSIWQLIHSWLPRLREFGEHFYGQPGTVFLPHAVDDRAYPIGSYWQGTIDPVSTLWMATLAWQEAKTSGSTWLTQEVALPLLLGSLASVQCLVGADENGNPCLPISVSPEYGEGAPGTWGKNASFALAAIHHLLNCLREAEERGLCHPSPEAISWLGRLPKASTLPQPNGPYDDPHQTLHRIALWEGQDLDHSHRHHSHLAGIHPFPIFGPQDQPLVKESLTHWANTGGGQWSAWGVIWAIQIMAAAGWKKGAGAWLGFLIASTLNEGKSLSAGGARGCYISWGSAEVAKLVAQNRPSEDHEVMQLDANIGLISAILAVHHCEEKWWG